MSTIYEEIIHGESIIRAAPNARHETICARLHAHLTASLPDASPTKILPARSIVQLTVGVMVRPDIALVTVATGKVWLAAEVIDSHDHRPDTVLKKTLYEDFKLSRLWMVDPRYNNVEFYHGTSYGLALKGILAGKETLQESLLPDFQLSMAELFAG